MNKLASKHRSRHRQCRFQQAAVADTVVTTKAIDLALMDPKRLFNFYKSDDRHRNLLRQFLKNRLVSIFNLLHHCIKIVCFRT